MSGASAPGTSKLVMNQRQRAIWPVIIVAAFFEGFDDSVINIALPYIKTSFAINDQMAGYILSLAAIGTLLAFFASRLADNFGRRRVFLWCVYLYAISSLLTAVSFWLPMFIAMQFLARTFLIGCWSTGYVIVCEEFPTEHRGTAVGRFQVTAVFGGLLVGVLLPLVAHTGLGWRTLYIVGALPIIPVFLMRNRLAETQQFQKLVAERVAGAKASKETFFAAWHRPHLKYLLVMAVVWFFMYFGVKGSLNFFSTRVVDELSWTPMMVSIAVLTSTLGGIAIIAFNGTLLDKLGRKPAAALVISVGSVFGVVTFLSTNTIVIILCNIICVGCMNSLLIIGSTLTNELFPTEVRSNAMAWTNNAAGRFGQILVPLFATNGLWVTLGHGVAVAMVLPLISLVFIAVFLPETSAKATRIESGETPEPALVDSTSIN